ncbi:hypothetical protein T4C_9563, partial [Trichinella pseudospiralis]
LKAWELLYKRKLLLNLSSSNDPDVYEPASWLHGCFREPIRLWIVR